MRGLGLLTAATKERVERLPYIMRYAVGILLGSVETIVNGECDESVVLSAMCTVQNNASGRYGTDDLLTYDKAGEVLGFGSTNRSGLKRLLDRNGIKEVKIGNIKVGFRRDEIMALKDRIGGEKMRNCGRSLRENT